MEKSEWLSQVRKGILEYVILLVVQQRPVYGYDLLTRLGRYEIFSMAEGTIYPLLRRMEKNGLIASLWQETTPGTPPRKYYSITALGEKTLVMMQQEFDNMMLALHEIKNQKEEKQA